MMKKSPWTHKYWAQTCNYVIIWNKYLENCQKVVKLFISQICKEIDLESTRYIGSFFLETLTDFTFNAESELDLVNNSWKENLVVFCF